MRFVMLSMFFLILFSGCGPPHDFPHTLKIDSRFTPAEQNIIKADIKEWETATGGIVSIKTVVANLPEPTSSKGYSPDGRHAIFKVDDSNPAMRLLNQVNPIPDSIAVGVTGIAGRMDLGGWTFSGDNILIDTEALKNFAKTHGDNYQADMRLTVLHELGHHFGMIHALPSEGNRLMQAITDRETPCIAPGDLERFCRLYDCSGRNVKTTCSQKQLVHSERIPAYE